MTTMTAMDLSRHGDAMTDTTTSPIPALVVMGDCEYPKYDGESITVCLAMEAAARSVLDEVGIGHLNTNPKDIIRAIVLRYLMANNR